MLFLTEECSERELFLHATLRVRVAKVTDIVGVLGY